MTLGIAFAGAFFSLLLTGAANAAERPNIVVLMSDQQRLDTVSCYGLNDVCKTPHIDALAARGVRFDSAFTPTAICSPARARTASCATSPRSDAHVRKAPRTVALYIPYRSLMYV